MNHEKPGGSESEEAARQSGRLITWLDQRTGIRNLLHEALDEPIPGGARFAYVFGSALLFIFLSQVITGVFLALYYVPSADHAHITVEYIIKEVSAGSFLRSIHAYGSSALVLLLLLHITQTFLYGAYKGRRELLWLSGCVLLTLFLGMAFTGYLLPWDQKAYFATAVGTNIATEVPLIGDFLKKMLRGGSEMGTLTVSRFFVAHVFLIPGLIFAVFGAHIYLFRKAGAAGPVQEDPVRPRMTPQPFYPRQVLYDLAFSAALLVALGLLAHYLPFDLGPKADSSDAQYIPRPEWFYLPMFQWLKYWSSSRAIIGVVVIPSVIALLFALTPFLDRKLERRPWRRPVSVGLYSLTLLGLAALGLISYRTDRGDPAVVRQLARQEKATAEFMASKFEPEDSSRIAASPLDPELELGKGVFSRSACDACHGPDGGGTAAGSKLKGLGKSQDQIKLLLLSPTKMMLAGGMSPVRLPDHDLAALSAYVASLK